MDTIYFIIGRSGLCSEKVSSTVRQAYHTLQGLMTLEPCSANDYVGRLYNRLNQNYRPLHTLCHFFLESRGASHLKGNRIMLPFLIEMAKLSELFVVEWLQKNPPPGFFVKPQHHREIGQNRHFRLNLLLCHVATGDVQAVLDTKYKTPARAANVDIYQMIQLRQSNKMYPHLSHLSNPTQTSP